MSYGLEVLVLLGLNQLASILSLPLKLTRLYKKITKKVEMKFM